MPRRMNSAAPAKMTVASDQQKERRAYVKDREVLCGGSLLELARDLNGMKEGLNNKGNKALAAFFDKKPTIKKKDIERQGKEMSAFLTLVKPHLLKELVGKSYQEN